MDLKTNPDAAKNRSGGDKALQQYYLADEHEFFFSPPPFDVFFTASLIMEISILDSLWNFSWGFLRNLNF